MEITVTIPPQEYNFSKYINPRNCYLAEALVKAGYQDVNVGGIGYTFIDGVNYRTKESFSSIILEDNFENGVDTIVTLIKTR